MLDKRRGVTTLRFVHQAGAMTARSISSPGENGPAVSEPARLISEAHRELLAQIAELYYDGGQTQTQIATLLRYSRSMISRYLTEARAGSISRPRSRRPSV